MESMLNRKANLSRLISNKKWRQVRSFLKTRNAKSQVVNSTDELGHTILSAALFHDAPIDIITALLYIDPLLSLEADANGLVPIHIACYRGVDSQIIQLLLQHDHGASARALDRSGNSPLHLIIENICDPKKCLEMAEEEFRRMENSTDMDDSSDSPKSLDSSCSALSMSQDAFGDCIRTVQNLCALAPEMVRHANKADCSAIDLVQEVKAAVPSGSRWERADIVYQLLRKYNVQLYMDEKKLSEMTTYKSKRSTGSVPSLVASSYGSSISSGFGGSTMLGDHPMDCSQFGD